MYKVLNIRPFNFTSMETLHRGEKLERALRAEGTNLVESASARKFYQHHQVSRAPPA